MSLPGFKPPLRPGQLGRVQFVGAKEGSCRNRSLATTSPRALSIADDSIVERVLRYPDGQERRIRYPGHIKLETEESISVIDSADDADGDRDWWGIECYYYGTSSDEEDEIKPQASLIIKPDERERLDADERQPSSRPPVKDFPSSPAELLRFVNSEEFKSAAEEQARLVRGSYQILESSPWLQTKAVFVLAFAKQDSENWLTYTLKTRVSRPQQEDELTKILGRRRLDGSSLIRVEEIRDGVVAFEDESDAHRYAAMLEADGQQAVVAECDSHTLFRETNDTRAVVVLVQQCTGLACHLPLPEELRASLRGKRSLEDPNDL